MSCLVCRGDVKRVGEYKGVSILRCQRFDCGFRFFDLSQYVSPYERQDYYEDWRPHDIVVHPWIRARVDLVTRFKKGGRVAELGCGIGETALAFSQAGFDVTGVEESQSATAYLGRIHPEIEWSSEDIATFLNSRHDSFDILTLFHVLEHIPRPREVVELLSKSLRPDGLIVVEVPDVGGGIARLKGEKWDYYLMHHVNYFDVTSLTKLFGQYGFGCVFLRRTYHFSHPQGQFAKDIAKGVLAACGLNSIIRTVWSRNS